MLNEIRVGAYFYPNEPNCPVRVSRANGKHVESEPVLGRLTKPLFPGHDQPRSYCLGDPAILDWDDAKPEIAKRHIKIAQQANLDFFVVDAYIGVRQGQNIHESDGFLTQVVNLSAADLGYFNFGMMYCFKAPRTVMSIKPGHLEPNRELDISTSSARFIVEYCSESLWKHPNYLKIGDRPYISFFLPGTGATTKNGPEVKNMFDEIRRLSRNGHGIDPYIVGIVSHRTPLQDAPIIAGLGVDAISGYSNILDFPQMDPVVKHAGLIANRLNEWQKMSMSVEIPVEPTVQVGLDISPRCQYVTPEGEPFTPQSIDELRSFIDLYPHSMIVTGSDAQCFEDMLDKTVKLVSSLEIPDSEKIITINAWNEITEGSCMLPRVRDGIVDSTVLESCHRILSV